MHKRLDIANRHTHKHCFIVFMCVLVTTSVSGGYRGTNKYCTALHLLLHFEYIQNYASNSTFKLPMNDKITENKS